MSIKSKAFATLCVLSLTATAFANTSEVGHIGNTFQNLNSPSQENGSDVGSLVYRLIGTNVLDHSLTPYEFNMGTDGDTVLQNLSVSDDDLVDVWVQELIYQSPADRYWNVDQSTGDIMYIGGNVKVPKNLGLGGQVCKLDEDGNFLDINGIITTDPLAYDCIDIFNGGAFGGLWRNAVGGGIFAVQTTDPTDLDASNNKVGINTDAPFAPLTIGVNGSDAYFGAPGVAAIIESQISGNVYLSHDGLLNDGVTVVGSDIAGTITGEGKSDIAKLSVDGSLHATGDIQADGTMYAFKHVVTSDANLKENVVPLQDALGKVLALEGVSFDWMTDSSSDIGFIAQQVEEVYPELVHTRADGYKAVQYANLIAPLVEAVQTQQEQIDSLEARIVELESLLK